MSFTSAMTDFFQVWKELDQKVTRQELAGNFKLQILANPGQEVSDSVYKTFKGDAAGLQKAVGELRAIAQRRRTGATTRLPQAEESRTRYGRTSPTTTQTSPTATSVSFNTVMKEFLQVFTDDLGAQVRAEELEAHPRILFLTRSNCEYSDALYKEFYPKREVQELQRYIGVLRSIAKARQGQATSAPAPLATGDAARWNQSRALIGNSILGQGTFENPVPFHNVAKRNPQTVVMPATADFLVFDYSTFTMKPKSAFIR